MLCPCCLKGALGRGVSARAREGDAAPNQLLCSALSGIVMEAAAGSALEPEHRADVTRPAPITVEFHTDAAMLSPKNTFITARWSKRAPVPHAAT